MKRNENGFVLITVLLISIVLTLLIFGASLTSMLDRQVASSQRRGTEAYYVAKAGIERLKAAVLVTLAEAYEEQGPEAGTFCTLPIADELVLGGDLRLIPGEAAVTVVGGPSPGDGTPHDPLFDDTQNYSLSYSLNDDRIVLRSVGRSGPSQSTIQLVATVGSGPTGVWDNAIYTERITPGAGSLAGTVSAYGSVHIIEGNINVDEESLELAGRAGIYNRYSGSGDGNAQTNVEAEAQNVFADAADRAQDLCARVKIKRGNLEIGQTNEGAGSRIGAPGEGVPNPNAIHGIYLGEGSVTSKGTPIDDVQAHANVHVRNELGSYDPFENVMPSLPDDYPDLVKDYIVDDPVNCPWIRLSGSGSDSSIALTLPPASGMSTDCFSSDGTLVMTWDATSSTVAFVAPPRGGDEIATIAVPDHDFRVLSGVYYRGEAEMQFGSRIGGTDVNTSKVSVRGSFVPRDGDYLDTSSLGLLTNGNVLLDVSTSGLAYGNDPVVAALIMSEGRVDVEKQVAIFGSLVGSEVTTKAVPSVAYNNRVARVAERMCLPGSFCAMGTGVDPNQGVFVNLSEERR